MTGIMFKSNEDTKQFAIGAIEFLFDEYFVQTVKMENNPENENEKILRFLVVDKQ